MTEELKACPFCGSKKITLEHTWLDGDEGWFTRCEKCGAYGPMLWADLDASTGEPQAIAWNRRHNERTSEAPKDTSG